MTNRTDVTIPAREYLSLRSAARTLAALDAAGVDNWTGNEHVDWASVENGGADVLTEVADKLAERAHTGQVDKAGAPYIDHPRAVADMVRECGPTYVQVALLHDTVEDTDLTLDDLREVGFPTEVIDAVDALTRRDGETYAAFVRRAAANRIGCVVKLADNMHNTSRLGNLDEPVRSALRRRYDKALNVLLEAADRHAAEKARARLAETYAGPALAGITQRFDERYGLR